MSTFPTIQEDPAFTTTELAIFKRYLEENAYYSVNNFEYLENNMAYYSGRYTSEHYFSPAELFHANSSFPISDEIGENVKYCEKAIEWYYKKVHPQDSQYVLKNEKYFLTEQLPPLIKGLVERLNSENVNDFYTVDLITYYNGKFIQYLPNRDFVFLWKQNALTRHERLVSNNYFIAMDQDIVDTLKNYNMAIFPIFTPIRKMLFLGEYGYRTSLIDYGKCLEKITSYFHENNIEHVETSHLKNQELNEYMGIDGIEKSVQSLILMKGE